MTEEKLMTPVRNTHDKTCARCKEKKSLSSYSPNDRRKDGRASYCKVCAAENMVKRNKAILTFMRSFQRCCCVCGYYGDKAVLEFHHLDPAKKTYNISRMTSHSQEKVRAEIAKCVVLCSNCHAHEHYLLKKGETSIPWAEPVIPSPKTYAANPNAAFQRRKKKFIGTLKTSCVLCKESRKHCLDLHHLDPSRKEKPLWNLSYADIEIESSHCVVLCRNHHKQQHSKLKRGQTLLV